MVPSLLLRGDPRSDLLRSQRGGKKFEGTRIADFNSDMDGRRRLHRYYIYLSFRVYDREANGWIRDKSVHDGFIREVFGMHYSSIDVSPMRYDRFERKKEKKNVRIEYCDLTEAEEKSGGGNPRQFLSSLFPLPLNAYHRASGKNSRAKFKSWKETGRRGFNFEFAVI